MKIVIKDANVFIDLELMGVLDLWMLSDYQTMTTTLVVAEIRDEHPTAISFIEDGAIEAVNLELMDFYLLYEELEASGVSAADVSVLYLAIDRNAILLSGDKALRNETRSKGVECRGTIWVLEELIRLNLLSEKGAASKLEKLLSHTGKDRRFLPISLCQEYINKWRREV